VIDASPSDGPGGGSGGGSIDARGGDAAVDAVIDSAPAPFCDPADPHIVACYPFDGDALDHGPHGLATLTRNVRFAGGKVGMAMLFGADSGANVADTPLFDVTALTIEAWINPSVLPDDGERSYVLDDDQQYAVFFEHTGDLTCALVGPGSVKATGAIAAGAWHHVACTYSGESIKLYVDGAMVSSATGNGSPSTTGATGVSIAAENPDSDGARLIGLVDELRLLDTALPAVRLCADAGRVCPGGP
jgi:hypothetical protein